MPTILVIDDQAEIRAYLRIVLEQAGHRVWEAAEGEEGLRLFQAEPPDLVLCDLHMPGREGLETIRDIARLGTGVPVVAMSGVPLMLAVAQMLGAVAILDKPIRPQSILQAVEAWALQQA